MTGGRGRGMDWVLEVGRRKLFYVEWTKNNVLLCGTGTYVQFPGMKHNGKEYKEQ